MNSLSLQLFNWNQIGIKSSGKLCYTKSDHQTQYCLHTDRHLQTKVFLRSIWRCNGLKLGPFAYKGCAPPQISPLTNSLIPYSQTLFGILVAHKYAVKECGGWGKPFGASLENPRWIILLASALCMFCFLMHSCSCCMWSSQLIKISFSFKRINQDVRLIML